MKISVFVHDLSGNPIVRAFPLIRAMQQLGHEVEVLGLTYNTNEVYLPYRGILQYKTIRTYLDIRWVIINGIKLSRMASGDVVYAFKGVWGSFFPALLYSKFGLKRKLLFDEEDNELWDAFIGKGFSALFKNPFYPINPIYNRILHPFVFLAKHRSVVCSRLQKRYGGALILHGPDSDKYDPLRFGDRSLIREKYGVPKNKRLLLFAGRPVFYNGLSFVTTALLEGALDWHLVLVGNPEEQMFIDAKNKLRERCHVIGFVPHDSMPELLHMCDAVPVIQLPIPSTSMQVPAKLLEAMAMGKSIICHNVADEEEIIGDSKGWILKNRTTGEFLDVLSEIISNPGLVASKSEAARKYSIQHTSYDAIAQKLQYLIN